VFLSKNKLGIISNHQPRAPLPDSTGFKIMTLSPIQLLSEIIEKSDKSYPIRDAPFVKAIYNSVR